ncbi:MAG: DNA repair protein RadC [Clostridia bacterium]|nr:DNA repair protein RadC [Clostridia bacterium]
MRIKELPCTERPYEKLELYGEKALSNAELLAIIIKTGTKEETSVTVAQRILRLNNDEQAEDNLNFLRNISIKELMQIKGIGKIKAIQIKAVCEICTRMSRPADYRQIQVKKPKDIATLLMPDLKLTKREVAKVIILNSKNYIEKVVDVSLGGSNFASISIRDVLNEVIKMQAPKFIIVHNHPSGDSKPSKQDVSFTNKLYEVSKIMGIELVDHIVIGNMNFTSIFEQDVKNMKG